VPLPRVVLWRSARERRVWLQDLRRAELSRCLAGAAWAGAALVDRGEVRQGGRGQGWSGVREGWVGGREDEWGGCMVVNGRMGRGGIGRGRPWWTGGR
jgi:hypothetical protein